MAVPGRLLEGRVSLLVLDVPARPRLQQQQHHLLVPVLGGRMQRSAPARVPTVDIRSVAEEDLRSACVAKAGRISQRVVARLVGGVNVCPVPHQYQHRLVVAAHCCYGQRVVAFVVDSVVTFY